MQMPTQDDGGIGANLVSMDQMAKNLVREKDTTKAGGKKEDDENNTSSNMLGKLDNVAAPVSPEPHAPGTNQAVVFSGAKVERPSVRNRPFDLSNQLKELRSNALEHRSAAGSSQGMSRDGS